MIPGIEFEFVACKKMTILFQFKNLLGNENWAVNRGGKISQSDRACVIIFARCKITQKDTYRLDVCYHLKSASKSLTTLDMISTFFLGNHVTSRDMKRKTTVFLASSVKGWSCKFLPELHPCPSIILARKLTVQAKEILFCTHQL